MRCSTTSGERVSAPGTCQLWLGAPMAGGEIKEPFQPGTCACSRVTYQPQAPRCFDGMTLPGLDDRAGLKAVRRPTRGEVFSLSGWRAHQAPSRTRARTSPAKMATP